MTNTIQRLRSESHVAIGELIADSVDELIRRWVERAKAEQPTAQRVHHLVLIDHLPAFLAKLGNALATAGDDSGKLHREASEHGDQRWDTGWSITEVVRDYQILRLVLAEFLEESLERPTTTRESLVLNLNIDDAIASAVAAFAASQVTPGTAATTTRNEALELLLNVLGVVGHEIRNPLAPLANSLEILRMAGSDPLLIEKTRLTMSRQLRVISRLVEDLMDLPRLARGKMSLVTRRLDVVRLVRACAEDIRSGLEAAGLTVALDLPSTPVWIEADDTRLAQVICNLLGNAQKFTNRGGTVTVEVAVGSDVAISVRDTGIGIDAAVLPRVFEAYTQADDSLDRSRGGLGLGLALVKGVVELHGGSVRAESAGLGFGSAFTVRLPLLGANDGGQNAVGVAEAAAPSVGHRRILVIEDNLDSAESMKDYLELHGHTVEIATSGPAGIAAAASFLPDVVLCDLGLPGLDGYGVAEEIRKSVRPMPTLFVAISGRGGRRGPDGEPDKAFDYYLLKPADPARVAQLIAADRELPHDSTAR